MLFVFLVENVFEKLVVYEHMEKNYVLFLRFYNGWLITSKISRTGFKLNIKNRYTAKIGY